MFRTATAALLFSALLVPPAYPVPLNELPWRFVTADGAWDCRDQSGTAVGTMIVADKTYAFITMEGIVGGYGRLHRVGEAEYDLPVYVILDGYLKEEFGAHGTTLRGPKGNTDNYAAGIFLILILEDKSELECVRREAPGA